MQTKIRRVISSLMCVILFAGLLMNNATAACKHNRWWYDDNICYNDPADDGTTHKSYYDVCSKCKHIFVHDTKGSLPFVARVDGVKARKAPYGSAKEVKTYKANESMWVTGRIRNQHDNVWLRLSDDSYIYVDNVALDFDTLTTRAWQYVKAGDWAFQMLCAFYTKGIIPGMYDLKQSFLLGTDYFTKYFTGNNGTVYGKWHYNKYYIYSNGIVQSTRLNGEELGNVLYGVLWNKNGMSYEESLVPTAFADYFAGDSEKARACLSLQMDKCDDQNDRDFVYLGFWVYDHAAPGVAWDFSVKSPYTSNS